MADIPRLQREIQERFKRLAKDTDKLAPGVRHGDAILILCDIEETCDRINELVEKLERET